MANTKTIQGSCHCGAVAYSAKIDLDAPTLRCNCSICRKSRAWLALVPSANFTLKSGKEQINTYQFGDHEITHCSCNKCGIRTFGKFEELGSDGDIAISIATLDLTHEQMSRLPISYLNGASDDFANAPKITNYL
jgi:hypothetical protein